MRFYVNGRPVLIPRPPERAAVELVKDAVVDWGPYVDRDELQLEETVGTRYDETREWIFSRTSTAHGLVLTQPAFLHVMAFAADARSRWGFRLAWRRSRRQFSLVQRLSVRTWAQADECVEASTAGQRLGVIKPSRR